MTNALPLWAENLAVLDTETTGVNPEQHRVVSCTIATLNGDGDVTERYDWLLDPGVEIPEQATRVHGISTEVARASGMEASVGIAQIVAQLSSMFERGYPVVVYNAPFDLSMLRAESARYGTPWLTDRIPPVDLTIIDPLIIDRQVDRYRKGKRTLELVAAHYGVTLDGAHDAGEDAIAAGRVAQKIAQKYASVLPDDADSLHLQQIDWSRTQAASFQEYMRRVRDPNFVANGNWPLN